MTKAHLDTRITVVIPTRDRSLLLAGAIESVLESPLTEATRVIVVDDGSTDDTSELARSYEVRYIRVEGHGPSGSRNAGLALARSEFVAFLDDDDRWLPGNMVPQLEALLAHPPAAFAFGRVQRTTFELEPFGAAFPEPPLPSGNVTACVTRWDPQLGAVLFRRSLVEAAGGFDVALRFNEDQDLLLRLAAQYPAVGVDHVGSLFRQRWPNAQDAELRWRSHLDHVVATRKWRALGIVPWRVRALAELRYRGLTSYYFCEDARARLRVGRKRDGLRSLLYAMRVSAAHSLVGHRRFWSVLPLLIRPGV